VRRQFGLAVSRGADLRLVARRCASEGRRPRAIGRRRDHQGWRTDLAPGGEPAIEDALVPRIAPAHAIGVIIGFNDGQARRIFAGSDFTLMPSRFEPCGLSQMYAQRSARCRSAHQTGGCRNHRRRPRPASCSRNLSAESFLGGVRAPSTGPYRAKDRLNAMRSSAMAKSYSWELSAAATARSTRG